MNTLEIYINLILKMGVCLKPRQKLLIWCPVNAADFARKAMRLAYEAGAETVDIFWEDEYCELTSYSLSPGGKPEKPLEWNKARLKYWEESAFKMLWVYTYKNISGNIQPQSYKPKMPDIYSCVAYAATPEWASAVFPSLDKTKALQRLWDSIFTACHTDSSLQSLEMHFNELQMRAKHLTELCFKALHFTNSLGTDLTAELPERHIWLTCTGVTAAGDKFFTNLPTEEVFTAPLRTGVNGIVYAAKPIVYMGELITEIKIMFKKGKAVQYSAKKNEQLLINLLTQNANADFLGEVALVPHSSPISRLGLFWYDTSFDENAACHLAFGNAYSQALEGANGQSEKQLLAMGLNRSPVHEDFMIGTSDMCVTGIKPDGQEIPVILNGEWAFNI